MENGSELLSNKKINIIDNIKKIKESDSTSTSSLQPKKLKLRNEITNLMNLVDNSSPKKLKDFPICLSLYTNNLSKNKEIQNKPKSKEKEKENIIAKEKLSFKNEEKEKFILREKFFLRNEEKEREKLNLKSIRPKYLKNLNLNLNEIIKPNNKKILSRNSNLNYFNSLSPNKKSNNISSFIRFTSEKKAFNSSKIILNKINKSPSSFILNKSPIIINQIGSNNSLLKLNTKFNNSNSTIDQDISFIKNIKGLSLKSIFLSDKKVIPSLFSSPKKTDNKPKKTNQKINKKQLFSQMTLKFQKDINNIEKIYEGEDLSKMDEISKDNKDKIDINKRFNKHKTFIINQSKNIENNKDKDKEKENSKENNKNNLQIIDNKKTIMNSTFNKASNINKMNIGKNFDIRLTNKFLSNQIMHKKEDILNVILEKNAPNIEQNQRNINNSKLIENKTIENKNNNINNKVKMDRLSRLKNSSLKSGLKAKNKVTINEVKDEENKNENNENKGNKLNSVEIKRKQTDVSLLFRINNKKFQISENEKQNDDFDLDIEKGKINRYHSTKVLDKKRINLFKIKKNKFYLTICKDEINNLYKMKKNKFLKKYRNNMEFKLNQINRKIYINKIEDLQDYKDKIDKIINTEKSYLQIHQNSNKQNNDINNIYYEYFLYNKKKTKYNETEISTFKIKSKFNCNLGSCSYKSIITPINFDGFPREIMISAYKKKNMINGQNNKNRSSKKNFHTVKLKTLNLPNLEKEKNKIDHLEKFSISKTKRSHVDELSWIYSPINLLTIQAIIIRNNDFYYETKSFLYPKRRSALKRSSLSFIKKIKKSNATLETEKVSLKKVGSLNYNQFIKFYKKTVCNEFSVLNQKKFFKRGVKRKSPNSSFNTPNKRSSKITKLVDTSFNESDSDRLSSIEKKDLENIYFELLTFIMESKNRQFFKLFEIHKSMIDVNQALLGGNTLLIISAKHGNFSVAKFLCDQQVNVNIQNNNGNTALHYAIGNQFYSIADILTRAGAREDIPNKKGLFPWDCIDNNLE